MIREVIEEIMLVEFWKGQGHTVSEERDVMADRCCIEKIERLLFQVFMKSRCDVLF